MRRIAVLLLAMLMVASIFAGGSKESAAATDPNTVELWCWDETFNIPAAEMAAEIYKESHPDFNLQITNLTFDDIVTRMTAAILGGQDSTLPDIMLMADTNIKKFVTLYPEYFVALNDSGIDFSQFSQYKVEAATVDGNIYAVPFDTGTSVAVYNTELLAKAGLTVDDLTGLTWDEFIAVAEPAVKATGLPMLVSCDNQQIINCLLQSTGHWYFDADDNLAIAGNPGLEAVFTVIKEMVDKGILQFRSDMDSYYSAFYDGSAMGTMNACWVLNNFKKDPNQAGKWMITDMPIFDDVEGASHTGNTGGSAWVILGGGNTELAIDFMKETFAGSPELYNELIPAISGVGTYLPALDQPNYTAPDAFFSNQPIYEMILGYSANVPRVNYGIYTAEAQDAVKTALTAYRSGQMSLEDALNQAQSDVSFLMI